MSLGNKRIRITLLLLFISVGCFAQDTISTNPFTLSGYAEVYYCYDLSEPKANLRPSFFYSYNRHNEINLNIGTLKANYTKNRLRGNLAFMAGTYAQYNLANEPSILKNVYEGNIGFKLSGKNLWLDAGILPSHIGFESAIGKDCWNLTRSILADNSPYYETGIRLSYTTKNEKFYGSFLILNGWQRIQRVPANQSPAFGSQLTLKPSAKITLNWSTFAGNNYPDSLARWRYFNNFYAQLQLTKNFGLIFGFDYGLEQRKKAESIYNNWYSPVLIVQYKLNNKLSVALRGEYYSDEKGVIISTGTKNGFQTFGYSVNLDYYISENMLIRIEGRTLQSKDPIFLLGNKNVTENSFLTTSVCIPF